MPNNYRHYKRQQLMEKHDLTIDQYVDCIGVSEKLCEAIQQHDLSGLDFSDYEWKLLQIWVSVVENEKDSLNNRLSEE